MVISTIAGGIWRGVENVQDTVSETFFEPVIRLGVTGLARSGKTVFITSLVANLMDRGRMHGLVAAAEGRISAAYLQPQPDDTVPRFDNEVTERRATFPIEATETAARQNRLTWMLLMSLVVASLMFPLWSLAAGTIERLLGPVGINVTTRLLGMLLAALSVQFVLDGLTAFGFGG